MSPVLAFLVSMHARVFHLTPHCELPLYSIMPYPLYFFLDADKDTFKHEKQQVEIQKTDYRKLFSSFVIVLDQLVPIFIDKLDNPMI